jgi:hypothetical protein
MRPIILFLVLIFAALATSLNAQSPLVTGFSPASGSTNVPLNAQVSITYSTPIGTNIDQAFLDEYLVDFVLAVPEDAITYNSISLSADRRTLTINVTHEPETVYHWVIPFIPSEPEQGLGRIFAATYSTGALAGSFSISGAIDYDVYDDTGDDDGFSKSIINASTAPLLKPWQRSSQNGTIRLSSKAALRPIASIAEFEMPDEQTLRNGTIVFATLESFAFFDDDEDGFDEDEDPTFLGMAVPDVNNGQYEIRFLGDGTHYITAYFLDLNYEENEEQEDQDMELFGVGYYNASGNLRDDPDPVVISGANRTGIDFTVFLILDPSFFIPSPVTALESLGEMLTAARNIQSDAQLFVISGSESYSDDDDQFSKFVFSDVANTGFLPNGTSFLWIYQFYSASSGMRINGISSLFLGNIVVPESGPAFDFPALPLDLTIIDSREAVRLALLAGAREYIESLENIATIQFNYTLSSNKTGFEGITVDTDHPFWHILMSSFVRDAATGEIQVQNHQFAINALNGEVIDMTLETSADDNGRAEVPGGFMLMQNFPNPFNPSTAISFELPVGGSVQLAVYDVTGRRVAELMNGSLPMGRHSVSFDASGLSSGVYVYTLSFEGRTETRKMLLMK